MSNAKGNANNRTDTISGTFQQDWANRDFTESVSDTIQNCVSFLNKFESSVCESMSRLDSQVENLERNMAFLEAKTEIVEPKTNDSPLI
ncbi:MAG: hypothetical protein SGCHY_000444 [Lobulomycetales sp.]